MSFTLSFKSAARGRMLTLCTDNERAEELNLEQIIKDFAVQETQRIRE